MRKCAVTRNTTKTTPFNLKPTNSLSFSRNVLRNERFTSVVINQRNVSINNTIESFLCNDFTQRLYNSTSSSTLQTHTSSDENYFENRVKQISEHYKSSKYGSYPIYKPTMSLKEFRDRYENKLEAKEKLETEENISLVGRITAKRIASKNLVFYTIENGSGEHTVQIMASKRFYSTELQETVDSFKSMNQLLKRGDVIGVRGIPGKTGVGELSLVPREMILLSPCLHALPDGRLESKESRFRNRSLDMIVNPDVKQIFQTRSKMIRFTRRFLEDRDFMEVETPILGLNTGGAAAKPFNTHLHALDLNMKMRIAPELYLKQLVVGGFEKVFEIGKQFRNEGVDATHNPEFTTVEFYQAYSDYQDLMTFTETYFNELVKYVKGSNQVKITIDNKTHNIDFTPPFRRVSIIPELEKQLKTKLPHFEDQDCTEKMLKICQEHQVPTHGAQTYGRILDHLVTYFIEPNLIQPTFLCDHPIRMSPLARSHRDSEKSQYATERFELFIGGKEVCNAYTELNDPYEQRERFRMQTEDLERGDDEAQQIDEAFCKSLEYGMPPTAGWGIGVDRIVMMLTGQSHIREVLLFPVMKPILFDNTTEQQENDKLK